ncbi:MAG: hypothetical protein E6147_06110 [Peptostreptococcus sp.]|uniref:hypothetical protein n=1 Tax=Peptostreptococcus sp. TaxID=1262 RepID=UPI00290B625B|nr:hypothetical protein [Peptostreptococcus sp.]MDU5350551.1 hypothetical protein [Peptostreptococcus sp.]MDU5891950.1 hypothetical protein [Peptostreptococcus sp.]
MKIKVINYRGDIFFLNPDSIYEISDCVCAGSVESDKAFVLYWGENTNSVMKYIGSLIMYSDYSNREEILINLYKFDTWCNRFSKEKSDDIKHGDKIMFNSRESYVIDLDLDFDEGSDYELFDGEGGILIFDYLTMKPVDRYLSIESLNLDYKEYHNNEIVKLER